MNKPLLKAATVSLAVVTVLAVLATVFMAYLNPHVVRDLATQLWACF